MSLAGAATSKTGKFSFSISQFLRDLLSCTEPQSFGLLLEFS